MKLEIQNLIKQYNDKMILNDISYTFEKGKIYGLLGRNGAGKTTFFNCLNADIKINDGKILLDGEDIKTEDIGYVMSTPEVPEFLTGKEFIHFFIEVNNIENPLSIEEYFQMIKLSIDDQNKLLKDYSHGMKNKIQMLVNIIGNYKVLLLDEPLTSFDVIVAEEMKELLRSLKKDRIIIFSTHIMDLALDLCDDIVIINNQKLSECPNNKEEIINILKGDNND